MSPFSLYIHIPYCSKICPYCDFTTYAVKNIPIEEYCDSLERELEIYSKGESYKGRRVETIFWGGGTPSLVHAKYISRIHETVEKLFGFSKEKIEITLEANPGQLDREKTQALSQAGINRLSLGAQSMQPRILELLGRDHLPSDIAQSVEFARDASIENINIDLIFSVPQQTPDELFLDIEAYHALTPTHISTYNLTIEKGTPFFQAVANGVFHPPSEEEQRELYELLIEEIPKRGYEQYEISNFAKREMECLHNIRYWTKEDYLGVGVGAHSYQGSGIRSANTASVKEYHAKLGDGALPHAWREEIGDEESRAESIMLGLRLREGVREDLIFHGLSPQKSNEITIKINELEELALATRSGGQLQLTKKGFPTADAIAGELI